MIDGQNFLDQPIRNNLATYDIRKTVAGQGNDYTTGCLLDYIYFKIYYKMIAIDSKVNNNHLMLIQKHKFCRKSRKAINNIFHY